jgi:hypothetical protein
MAKETIMITEITEIDTMFIRFLGRGYIIEVEGRNDNKENVTERDISINHDEILDIIKECDVIYAKS